MQIFISSTPTIEEDDLKLAKTLLKKSNIKNIDIKLPGFDNKEHFYTNTGRASLYILLKALNISKGDEVVIQSFTCVALVIPLLWLNIKPVYTDIDLKTFNMTLDLLKKRITEKTRAVIVQHTFGIPTEVEKIKEYIDKLNEDREKDKKIYLIEDCAHCLNIQYKDKYLGSFGDASFFSFGQDKVVSTTQGGCLIANKKEIESRVVGEYNRVSDMPDDIVKYNLRYPIFWDIIKKTYFSPKFLSKSNRFSKLTIGKALILLFRFFGLIKKQASNNDFGNPNKDVFKLSIKQKHVLKNQLEKLDRLTKHREKIVLEYSKLLDQDLKGSLIRYPLVVDNPAIVKNKLQKIGVISGNWYNYPVIPKGLDLKKIKYHIGRCPNTEYIMEHMINLPTGIDVKKDSVREIVSIVGDHVL
jgi:dTDP-4-amino-4,6-dideoxygalactose transaminase